jgi:hypothetical protein
MLSPANSKIKKILRFCAYVFLAAWLAALILIAINRQAIADWWQLRGYVPPPSVISVANEDTMDAYTKHLFYLNRPQFLPTVASFRSVCPENENTIVLGCYHPVEDGIYIYNIADPTLAGVVQVTAAHEVLHAVYARLSPSARTALDNELENYYQHGLTNPLVKAEVKLYQQTEPHSVYDEMSCTFGTEIANLPPALDAYYAQFFNDRATIVAYEQQYQTAFSSRQAMIIQDDTQLSQLKVQISNLENQLRASLTVLNSQLANINSLRPTSTYDDLQSVVAQYNGQVDSYNDSVVSLQGLIGEYNQLVNARNQIAGELTTLDSAIDTRITPTTQPSQ